MALTRQSLNKFFEDRKPYLEEIIMKDREYPTIWSQFLNTKSASTGWVDTATASGYGLFSSKAELEDAQSDDIMQGPVARTTMVTYAKRSLISQEAIEDDQGDGIIASRMPQMMRAGRATQEVLAHDLLNSGGTLTTPDGISIFNTNSHVTINGISYGNRTDADLTAAQLATAITTLENQVDDRGIPIMQMAKTLVVHPSNKFLAAEILESALKPGVTTVNVPAPNDINVMKGIVNLVVTPYLTDTDSWFLFADQHDLNFRWRLQPENWSEVDYVKSAVEFGIRFRCAVEALDPRGVWGSYGA